MWKNLTFDEKVLLLAEWSYPVRYVVNEIAAEYRAEWFERNRKSFAMEVHRIDGQKLRDKDKDGPTILIINGERHEKTTGSKGR